jgi:hypothetical protein
MKLITACTLLVLPYAGSAGALGAQATPPAGGTPPSAAPANGPQEGAATARRGPRPYAQVITARARTDKGGISVHKVDDRFFFEV